jgi:hypothetical protein
VVGRKVAKNRKWEKQMSFWTFENSKEALWRHLSPLAVKWLRAIRLTLCKALSPIVAYSVGEGLALCFMNGQ